MKREDFFGKRPLFLSEQEIKSIYYIKKNIEHSIRSSLIFKAYDDSVLKYNDYKFYQSISNTKKQLSKKQKEYKVGLNIKIVNHFINEYLHFQESTND